MKHTPTLFAIAALLVPGCQASRTFQAASAVPAVEPVTEVAEAAPEPVSDDVLLAQFTDIPMPAEPLAPPAAEGLSQLPTTGGGLSLEYLEQMALSSSPPVAQASAKVRALRGKWVQVGLAPNPTLGYSASEVGNEGKAGQQGLYAGQEFVSAGKLDKNRAIVSAEIKRAEQALVASEQRVTTDVRVAFYRALIAERRVLAAMNLVEVGDSAAETSQRLLKAGEITTAALLQSEVEQQNAHLALQTARNRQQQAWRALSAVVGGEDLAPQSLDGDLEQLPPAIDWQQQRLRITRESPEIAAAMAEVERAQRTLRRECVEAVPNLQTQVSVQYDSATYDTVTGIQAGIALPVWNRNQGAIRQAQAEITEARQNVDRLELDLQRRLAETYRGYASALAQTTVYRDNILPRAQKTLDFVRKGYPSEVGYLDVLTAQRVYSQANLTYLDSLGDLWENWAKIDGLLLDGSLSTEIELGAD